MKQVHDQEEKNLYNHLDSLLEKKIDKTISLEKHFKKTEEELEGYDEISILKVKREILQVLNEEDIKNLYKLSEKYDVDLDVVIVGLTCL